MGGSLWEQRLDWGPTFERLQNGEGGSGSGSFAPRPGPGSKAIKNQKGFALAVGRRTGIRYLIVIGDS